MRSFPAAKKFMIMQGHRQKQEETNHSTVDDPNSFISILRNTSISLAEITKIRVQLYNQPMSWIRSFLLKGGLNECCNLLANKTKKLK